MLPVLALMSVAAAVPSDGGAAEIDRRLQNIPSYMQCYRDNNWSQLGVPSPCALVLAGAREHKGSSALVSELKTADGLSEAAARAVFRAELAYLAQDERGERDEVLGLLSQGAQASPGNVVVLAELAGVASESSRAQEAFQTAVEASPDPDAAARAIVKTHVDSQVRAYVGAFLLSRHPENAGELAEWVDPYGGRPEDTALGLGILSQLGDGVRSPGGTRLADRVIEELETAGLAALAVEVLQSLPKEVQTRIESGSGGARNFVWQSDGGTLDVYRGNVREDLAYAYLAAGNREKAQELFSTATRPPLTPNGKGPRGRELCLDELHHSILAWHLSAAPKPDAFDIAVQLNTCRESLASLRPLAQVLSSVGSSAFRYQAKWRVERLGEWSCAKCSPRLKSLLGASLKRLDAAARAEAAALKAAAQLAQEDDDASEAKDAEPDGGVEVPGIYSEHSFPSGVRPFRGDPSGEAKKVDLGLPQGFHVVRSERHRARVLAVAASQAVDPTGEVSGGGYWLFESKDSGRTWGRPLYLGLRQYRPYVVAPASNLPLLHGESIQLEVQERRLDESSIRFPPVCTQVGSTRGGIYLEAKLADIGRDSDGDGLTDLLEERLLTNPNAQDTDGDGLLDGEDPLPRSPALRTEPKGPSLMDAFLAEESEGQAGSETMVMQEPGAGGMEGMSLSPLMKDRALFVVGAQADFGNVWSRSRIIVLSEREFALARRRFGAFYPLSISQLFYDERKERAFIQWSEGWRGGSYRATKENGRWVLQSMGEWIS